MKFETQNPTVIKLYNFYLMFKKFLKYMEELNLARLKLFLLSDNIIDYNYKTENYKLKDNENNYPLWKVYKANTYIIKHYFDKDMAKIGRKLENANIINFVKGNFFFFSYTDKLRKYYKMLKRQIIRKEFKDKIIKGEILNLYYLL
jgi:hypothetical protein